MTAQVSRWFEERLWDAWEQLIAGPVPLPDDWAGPHAADEQWKTVVTLPHEPVKYEEYCVPAFDVEVDVERLEWEQKQRERRSRK